MSTADMKSGILTGKLNSKSSQDGTTETDSLRADRLWYSDHYFGTAGKEKGNQGFPDLTKSPYQGWEEVAIEMANPAGQVDSSNNVMIGAPPVIENGVYQITGPEKFAWFSRMVNIDPANYAQANLKVTADLDISGTAYAEAGTRLKWLPIGKAESGSMVPYTGNADGGNFRIKGMYVEAEGGLDDSLSSGYQIDAGLFRYTDGGSTVSNFILTDGSVKGKSNSGFIGALVGRGQHTTITNCFNESVSVSAPGATGGLVGGSNAADFVINQCGNRATVTGEGNDCYAGGIVGRSQGGQDISNCYNVGTISSGWEGGGIIGYTKNNTKVRNCYTTATVTASAHAAVYGGIAGSCDPDTLENRYYENAAHFVYSDQLTGLTTAELQSWGAVWLLNGKKDGVWRPGDAANRNYPMFGSGLINWQQIGEAADSGLLDGYYPFTTDGNTEATAYKVETPEQLAWFLYKVNTDNANYKNKCLKLMNTINLYGNKQGTVYGEDIQWVPITEFSGVFDGNGFQIQDIRMSEGGNDKAFFYKLKNGTLKNLSTTGYIYAYRNAGMVVYAEGATITDCTNYVTRRGSGNLRIYSGGIVYTASDGTQILRCVNRGTTQRPGTFYPGDSSGRAGGIVSRLNAGCLVRDCYNRSYHDTNSTTIGGIVAENYGTVENCYNTESGGNKGRGAVVHAVVAFNNGVVKNCYYTPSDTDNSGSTQLAAVEAQTLAMAYRLNNGRTGTDAPWTVDIDNVNNGYAVLLPKNEPFVPTYRDWQDVASVVDLGGILSATPPFRQGTMRQRP